MRASALRSLLVLALCGLSVAARRGLSQASDKTQGARGAEGLQAAARDRWSATSRLGGAWAPPPRAGRGPVQPQRPLRKYPDGRRTLRRTRRSPVALRPLPFHLLPAAELLLSLPKACSNWAEKMVNITGADWVAGTSPCGANGQPAWKGVTCAGSGQVVKL